MAAERRTPGLRLSGPEALDEAALLIERAAEAIPDATNPTEPV